MTLAIVTPSHGPDLARFRALHESVLRHTAPDTMHYVFVPPPDVRRFSVITSQRLTVVAQPDALPKSFLSTTPLARIPRLPRGYRIAAVNLRRPWPPIRGWVFQQLVKLGSVASLDVDVVVILDSDLIVVRDIRESDFRHGDSVRHYRLPHGLNPDMRRHMRWRDQAARLLDIPEPSDDYADYVAGLMSWSPATVRSVLARVEEVSARPWATTLGSQLELSEYIIYGEYVSAMGAPHERAFVSDQDRCHTYWGPEPLTLGTAPGFIESMPIDDVALLVQSNTNTPQHVLDYVVNSLLES